MGGSLFVDIVNSRDLFKTTNEDAVRIIRVFVLKLSKF